MNIDYLVGFLRYLEQKHNIHVLKEGFDHYVDGGSHMHELDTEQRLKLAKEYRQYVINIGVI